MGGGGDKDGSTTPVTTTKTGTTTTKTITSPPTAAGSSSTSTQTATVTITSSAQPTTPSGSTATATIQSVGSASTQTFFGSLGRLKTVAIAWVMSAYAVIGFLSLPISPHPVVTRLIIICQSVMIVAIIGILRVGGRLEVWRRANRPRSEIARWETLYHSLVIVAFLMTPPTIYALDVGGPVDGILCFALLFYSIDAPPRWGVAAALALMIPHLTLETLIAANVIPYNQRLELSPSASSNWSNVGSTVGVYILAVSTARLYRKRVSSHLDELAEAGREVAARGVLLREARLDLQRATNIGERGRFTDQVLGSFVLGPILGSGGMGDVYEGTHRDTNERAAVKLLRPLEGSESTDSFRRFEREAAIVGKLDSPHIVRLLEVGGMEAPFPYMAMERLDGRGLNKILDEEGKLSPARVAAMVSQVAKGLSAAKKHDVVHRDIKPSNLFLLNDGHSWKILDFGLGRIAGDSATLTGGGLVGTLGYLAPEQLRGEGNVSHRTDIHALAIVAYRALTGRHVFVERDASRVMQEVESRLPPKPSSLSSVSTSVDDVLRVALAKDPRDRFADAEEFAKWLEKATARTLDEKDEANMRDRAKKLARTLDWTSTNASGAQRPVRGGGKKKTPAAEPTKTISLAPPTIEAKPEQSAATTRMQLSSPVSTKPAPAPPTASSTAEGGGSLTDTSASTSASASASASATTTGRVTLIASPDELVQSIWMAPARAVALSFAIATIYSYIQIPLTPYPEMRPFGAAVITLLLANLIVIRKLSADTSPRGIRRYHLAIACAFAVTSPLLYFFGPFGDTSSFVALALMLVGSGIPNRMIAVNFGAVVVPHTAIHLLITFGFLKDRGFYELGGGIYGHLLNLGQLYVLYGLGLILAIIFREQARATLKSLSDTFRQNTEREALLRDARLALERAMGIGQPGRFTGMDLGHFHLGVVLGRGGMGEVYEAIQSDTGEAAAVKLLSRRRTSDGDVLGRFAREAKTIAAIDSKHVVKVLDAGASNSAQLPFIAMERLVGSDLAAILQRRLFLPGKEVAEMVMQISEGLEVAHAKGIVHGDITPKNIFLTDEGVWKLLDFGVSVLGEARSEHREPAGTPAYLAPEQLEEGSEVDHRVDVHALGVVVYRSLTGRPAFAGRDAVTVLYRVLHDMPVAPSTSSEEVSELVDDVLRIALSKDPKDRFDRAATFAEALRAATDGVRDERIVRRAAQLTKKVPWSTKTKI